MRDTDSSTPAGEINRLRVTVADPPYPGQSKKHYGDHPDYAGEVDHLSFSGTTSFIPLLTILPIFVGESSMSGNCAARHAPLQDRASELPLRPEWRCAAMPRAHPSPARAHQAARRPVPKGVEVYPPNGTCDLNPEYAVMGEWARGICNECHQPLALHLTPKEWEAVDVE